MLGLHYPKIWELLMPETFDIRETVQATGATQRQIEHLVERKMVNPADPAPRRGVSRRYTWVQLWYIAVAVRLLNLGVEMPEVRKMIGTDQPVNRTLGFNKSFVEHVWDQLHDPEQASRVEVLLVFRIVDPVEPSRTVAYQNYFCPAESLVSAARTAVDGFFIFLPAIAEQIDNVANRIAE